MGLNLILAHASASSEAGTAALAHLHHQHFEWPHLRQLLGLMRPSRRLEGDDDSLSIPHETVLAQALGWHGEDGRWPWAARSAQQDGILEASMATTDAATGWGLLTPCHWHVGSDQISMLDPAGLNLSVAESHALLAALRPSFEAEGWPLDGGAALRWYTRHAVLADLPTASLDRAIGHSIHLWLHDTRPVARRLRRLQVEAQMLWHEHPVNQAREARGELSVNSFWISGCGRPQAQQAPSPDMRVQLEDALRAPLLAGDWAAWCQTWRELDAQLMADLVARVQRGEQVRLTLCGERHAQTFDSHPRPSWLDQLKSLGQRWQPNPVGPLLAAL